MEGILEGLLFVSGSDGISLDDIQDVLEITEDEAKGLISELEESLKDDKRGLKLVYLGNKYKLSTKEEHKKYYEAFVDRSFSGSLSQAALETLAIIAYNEPITIGLIDEIRGVSSREMVRRLLYRGLVDIEGKSDAPGRPNLYKTTDKFLDYFNLKSKDELPKINLDEEENLEEEDLFETKYKENN